MASRSGAGKSDSSRRLARSVIIRGVRTNSHRRQRKCPASRLLLPRNGAVRGEHAKLPFNVISCWSVRACVFVRVLYSCVRVHMCVDQTCLTTDKWMDSCHSSANGYITCSVGWGIA